MKLICRRIAVLSLAFVLLCAGCEQPQAGPAPSAPKPSAPMPQSSAAAPKPTVESKPPAVAAGYGPVRVSILPLTELTESIGASPGPTLHVFLALLDAYGSPIKAPEMLRFELYQYVPRSADPKGQRIAIWPDIDLTQPSQNNSYWRDFLRAYEFKLDVEADPGDTYILEATCMCPEGKRISAEFTLKPTM